MERPKKVVVADASVVVKWFVEEQYSYEALKLRDDYIERRVDIAAPSLLRYEVLNSLRYNPQFGLEELKALKQTLEEYVFWTFQIDGELADLTLETALRYGVTVYDASYISLAQLYSWTCYTADEGLLGKVSDRSIVQHVRSY